MLVAIAALPVAMDLGAYENFQIEKVTVLWCLAGSALILCALEGHRALPRARLVSVALLFLAGIGIATLFSQAKSVSLLGLPDRYGGLLPHVSYVMTTLAIVAVYWDEPSRLRQLAWAAVIGSMVLATYMLVQSGNVDPLRWYDPLAPTHAAPAALPFGTTGNSDFAGGYLAITAPLFVYLVFTARPRVRPVLCGALALDFLALWYAQSRGGIIAGLGGLATFWLASRRPLPKWARATVASAAALLIVGLFLLVKTTADRPVGAPGEIKIVQTQTLRDRAFYWIAAARIFAHYPLVGTGPDTFYANYHEYRLASDASRHGLQSPDKPHSFTFEYAATTGLAGLVPYLALTVLALRYGLRRARALGGQERLLVAAFVASFAAWTIQGQFSLIVPVVTAPGWILLGGIVVLADPVIVGGRGVTPPERRAPESSWVRTRSALRTSLALAGLAALVALGTVPLIANAKAGAGDLTAAGTLAPFVSEYQERAGEIALSIARATQDQAQKLRYLSEARRYLLRANSLKPRDVDTNLQLAAMYGVWGQTLDPVRFADSLQWWQELRRFDPHDPELQAAYRQARDLMAESMVQWATKALATPGDPTGWIRVARGYLALGDSGSARPALERALADDPSSAETRVLLAGLPP